MPMPHEHQRAAQLAKQTQAAPEMLVASAQFDHGRRHAQVHAVEEITSLLLAVGRHQIGHSHVDLAQSSAHQPIHASFGLRFVQSPEMRKSVDQSVRNHGQRRAFFRVGHRFDQSVQRTVQRGIAAHHHNEPIAVGGHHRSQALDAARPFALHEIVGLLDRIQSSPDASPTPARTPTAFLGTIQDAPA